MLHKLTVEEKASMVFVITPEALTGYDVVNAAGDATAEALRKYPVSGLIYFSQNIVSPEQTRQMLENTQNYARTYNSLPMILAVDEEGGTVLRVASNPEFGLKDVGNMADLTNNGGDEAAYEAGKYIGSYLSDLGFNVDFAPVADVLTNPDNTLMRARSFGTSGPVVAMMDRAFLNGLHTCGIWGCLKHFPGHGGAAEDSHAGPAVNYADPDTLMMSELVPYVSCIDDGVAMIMAGHIALPLVTGSMEPSSLSHEVLSGLLREKLGYDGLIITDSLSMGAITQTYGSGEAAVAALNAGADLLLMPADFQAAREGILQALENGTLSMERLDEAVLRIISFRMQIA